MSWTTLGRVPHDGSVFVPMPQMVLTSASGMNERYWSCNAFVLDSRVAGEWAGRR